MAAMVRDSLLLTGALSAVHLLGFTLVTGGAFVGNLRLLGVLLRERPVIEVTRPASRGLAIGLAVSVVTGLLLFAPRAVDASANRTFQTKMFLLLAAASFQVTLHRAVGTSAHSRPLTRQAVGAIGLLLWSGVAIAGAAYILLE